MSFKIFTKVATIRFNLAANHVIRPTQITFMQGRHILDGVVTLHETIHELHQKNDVILKINFERAYDKVKCPLLQVLRMKVFSEHVVVGFIILLLELVFPLKSMMTLDNTLKKKDYVKVTHYPDNI